MARNLTSDKKIYYSVALVTLAVLILALLMPVAFIRWGAAALLGVAALAAYVLVRKRSILSLNKTQVLTIISVSSILFLVLLYLSGLYFGFAVADSGLSLLSLLAIILPISLIVVSSELLRSVLLAQKNVFVTVCAFLIGVLSQVYVDGGITRLSTVYNVVDFICLTILPAITANFLFHYIASRYGMLPNIVYRCVISLYCYIIPFVPNAPEVLIAFSLLVLPILLYVFVKSLYETKQQKKTFKTTKWEFIPIGLGALCCISLVMLISCQFRFGALVIASPSMTGEINKGDAVVFESYEHCQNAQEGDVIVFTKSGKNKYVHRIIDVQTEDGQVRYITKGDANQDPDAGFVTDEQIVGIVRFKVLYIGYPSLWLYEMSK